MQQDKKPLTTSLLYLQLVFFSAVILYFGKILFIPLFFGLLIAIVMYPVCKWFEKHGWGKTLSITASLLIVTLLIVALLFLFVWQLKVFSKDAPVILAKAETSLAQLQSWLTENAGMTAATEEGWAQRFSDSVPALLNSIFRATANTLFILFLTPVYTALFLYHRKIFIRYLELITPAKYQQQLGAVIKQTVDTYFNYIKGMVLVYLIVGILNSIGLYALGVKHAVLFGMLCAIMTIIPYIGIVVSALLPISMVWMQTGNIWYPLGVIAVFVFVQYLEANVIFPKVVGTQLHVSTLAMLVAIIAGGIIWGVAGMVLFIPFVAILKIATDNIEEWKPLNLLLSRK